MTKKLRKAVDMLYTQPPQKFCPRCQRMRPIGEFYTFGPGKRYTHTDCKACDNRRRAEQKQFRKN